jgi:hypothetical protein
VRRKSANSLVQERCTAAAALPTSRWTFQRLPDFERHRLWRGSSPLPRAIGGASPKTFDAKVSENEELLNFPEVLYFENSELLKFSSSSFFTTKDS